MRVSRYLEHKFVYLSAKSASDEPWAESLSTLCFPSRISQGEMNEPKIVTSAYAGLSERDWQYFYFFQVYSMHESAKIEATRESGRKVAAQSRKLLQNSSQFLGWSFVLFYLLITFRAKVHFLFLPSKTHSLALQLTVMRSDIYFPLHQMWYCTITCNECILRP